MKKVNVCIIGGRLTAAAKFTPEVDVNTPGTKDRAWFRLANEEVYTPRDGFAHTNFFSCIAWGKNARIMRDFTMKGKEVLLEGRFKQDLYGPEGDKKEKVEFVVGHITLGRNPKDTPYGSDAKLEGIIAQLKARGLIDEETTLDEPQPQQDTATAGADSNSPF